MTEGPTNFRDVLKEFDKTAGLTGEDETFKTPEPNKKPEPPAGKGPEKGSEPPLSKKQPPKEGWDEVADDEFG
ncbi:MAG: hypothetical protein M1333_03030 [Patescibacteria group bacterium]|nr:hypothetical protein [Patescibacteria group bacterium]